jgi:hypothetical protein
MTHHNNHDDTQYLILNKRQTSWVIVAGLALIAVSFLVGYFWGQHTALDQFIEDTQERRFGDHIYTAMYTRYDDTQADDNEPDESADDDSADESNDANEPIIKTATTYHAQLIGYKASQKKEAEKFIVALKKQGINASLREHSSRSKRGRTIIWYQVITGQYADLNALQKVKNAIEKQYKLHDIKIVEEKNA